MAFFAHKHRFAKEELDEDKDLAKLLLVHLPRRLKEAIILVNTSIYDDCEGTNRPIPHSFTPTPQLLYTDTPILKGFNCQFFTFLFCCDFCF